MIRAEVDRGAFTVRGNGIGSVQITTISLTEPVQCDSGGKPGRKFGTKANADSKCLSIR